MGQTLRKYISLSRLFISSVPSYGIDLGKHTLISQLWVWGAVRVPAANAVLNILELE